MTYEYAWTISLAFIKGRDAAYVLYVALVVTQMTFIWILDKKLFSAFPAVKHFIAVRPSADPTVSMGVKSELAANNTSHILSLVGLFWLNFFVVVPFDCLYILTTIYYTATVVSLAQVGLAVLKILWTDAAITELLRRVSQHHNPDRNLSLVTRLNSIRLSPLRETLSSASISATAVLQRELETRYLMFHVFLVLLNNIAFPCLAVLVINSNCFYYAFFSASPIEVAYSFQRCGQNYFSIYRGTFCLNLETVTVSTSFLPPFEYGYQCSSMFIYMYMFVIISFINPIVKLSIKYIHSAFYSSSPEQSDHQPWLRRWLDFAVVPLLRPVLQEIPPNMPALFEKGRFVVRIVTSFSILVTYGVAFAPLAVVIACGILSFTGFEQLLVGRILTLEMDQRETNQLKGQTYRQILNSEMEGINDSMVHMVLVVAPFVSIFYAFFIFDTMGSAVGWKDAIAVSVLMVCTPVLIWVVVKIYFLFLSEYVETFRSWPEWLARWGRPFGTHSSGGMAGKEEMGGDMDERSVEMRGLSTISKDQTSIVGPEMWKRSSASSSLTSFSSSSLSANDGK
eukprot:CAMPEP_0170104130 /NCGR_PEP_ID=MMETSP0020_2-20130122/3931_1 /TAXON_ID=98059 /ORGANISM="Dinobryon sp., Strain UTEXLB2267" /LENGTH=565 /DNA_ID=CAMNT_0010327879 /DNA_START=1877 /DNA_END=3574 /DNA_ORIENTATION=-